jgi:uncharacterized protein YjbJ (UPF0337 family)
MGARLDKAKGKAKTIAGAATGNERLEAGEERAQRREEER